MGFAMLRTGYRAVLVGSAVLLIVVSSPTARAGMEPNSVLRVESNTNGEIGVEAIGVSIGDALRAIGAKAGFEVVIEEGITRRPVNLALSAAPVEDVLRQILRGRNYALLYGGDEESPTEVIVLPPPALRRPAYRANRYRPAPRHR
jgi:hypothetical protein